MIGTTSGPAIGAAGVTFVLFAGTLALLPNVETRSREERVLALLRDHEKKEGSWRYLFADFFPWAPEGDRPQLIAAYDLFCADMSRGIDDARFRELGLEVCRIYDLAPATEVAWTDQHVSARLDGLDLERKIGFELRGRGDPESHYSVAEEESEILDDAELVALQRSGLRLYVTDRKRYSDDEDGFTPALAFVAGLVRFLNDATDGEDIDLDGLLFEREGTWTWPLRPTEGMRLETGQYGPELVVERAGTISIFCRGLADFGPPKPRPRDDGSPNPRADLPHSSRGAPSVVVVKYAASSLEQGAPRPDFHVRYRQMLGARELVHECRSLVAFLPSAFDLAQPFDLELDLAPGRYCFYGGSARVGMAAGPP